jgi:hypothetical protein
MRRHLWMPLALVAPVALLSGCVESRASGLAATPSLTLKTEGGVTEVTPTPEGYAGATIQLQRRPNGGLAGFAYGRTVDLRLSEQRIQGSFGSAPVELTLERGDGVVTVRGMFGGALGNLAIRPDGLEGSVGSCSYSLKGSWPGTLEGRRSCGTLPEVAYLRVPGALVELPGPELAAVITVVLAG